MGKGSKMFGEEKIGKLLIKFSIPIIISFLIAELYNMVDTLFVGRNVGGLAIGALVLVFPIQRLIIALSVMISTGTSTAFSRANGEEDIDKSKEIFQSGFSFCLLIMIGLILIVSLFKEKILVFLGASPNILPLAMEYLEIIIFGSIFLSLTIFISNICITLGNNKVSIISNAIGAGLNIILDYILIVHFKMGIKGAAIATLISQIIGFLYAFYNYLKINKKYNLNTKLNIKKNIITPILLVGLAGFVVEIEDGIVMGVLNNLLAHTSGDTGIIVLGLVSKLYMFLFVTMWGIASAMQPIASFNVGAKNYKRLKTLMKKTTIYAFSTTALLWGIGLVFTKQLLSFFVKDALLIEEAAKAFRIVISLFPLISIYYVSIFYFQAMGKARTSILISGLRQIIIMIPLSILFVKVFDLGAMGIWISYPISDLLASLASFMLIRNEGLELNIRIEKQREREKVASAELKYSL
ncbi:MATE family efflux transporter [Tissierella creatinophila]|uniref:Multidrug export protein MepA n=1 Tax=Tissierella creatinophila DSM 6911 TaxID=1123403 RepID=A0A1U7M8T4_TISCR|nr:MATE family efflux transporter [Tissierella creatinophila]OLS03696.1 multidrug export protein MepA [Tissierella creatinophila DSM 6911]